MGVNMGRFVTTTVTAVNRDGYELVVLVQDQQQVRMHDGRLKDDPKGVAIDVADFPEAVRFVVRVREG